MRAQDKLLHKLTDKFQISRELQAAELKRRSLLQPLFRDKVADDQLVSFDKKTQSQANLQNQNECAANFNSTLSNYPQHSQKILPDLQVQSMRKRAFKAFNMYSENIKMYNRLTNTKSTIPSVEALMKQGQKREKILKSISQFKQKKSARKGGELVVIKKEDPCAEFERRQSKIRSKVIRINI